MRADIEVGATFPDYEFTVKGALTRFLPVTRPHSLLRSANRTRESNASIARVPGGPDAAQTANPK